MQKVVFVESSGFHWFLKGTTWTSQIKRADKFADDDAAQTAINRAKKFIAAGIRRKMSIIPLENAVEKGGY